ILPSHVFYSRLGMQEALSTFLFLCAFYLYVFSRGTGLRLFASALVLSFVFFTNYRMIIAPVYVILAEIWLSLEQRRPIDLRRLVWFVLVFYGAVFCIGGINGGQNTYVTFAWMFHQADQASGQRHWLNFFSFPYYVFALENFFFGLMFFSSFYLTLRKKWEKLLPWMVVIAQMALFSFAAEKGARYMCVVLPFMAMAAAHSASFFSAPEQRFKKAAVVVVALSLLGLAGKSVELTRSGTDYGEAVRYILSMDPQARIISTQPLVEALYLPNERAIVECPKELSSLLALSDQGYRYLILDPQAYISWTSSGQRFTPLLGFLALIRENVLPLRIFPHLNEAFLTRFVLDHNENLRNSLRFLNGRDPSLGEIRIYDLTKI
ncbi:MAG TPA: hypothetical protein VD905_14530, partial [Flavobacteriales bacterium]|nr:hypothetical protein [Flavobacteriales bacterium]